jgi:amino acid transporter
VTGVDDRNPSTPTEVAPAAEQPDLRRGVLSLPEVLAQSVANMAPSAAMALLPLLVFLNAGNGSWLSFVIALVLMLFVGFCITQFAKRTNASGSFYNWVRASLGVGADIPRAAPCCSATSPPEWPPCWASASTAPTC